MYVIAIDDDPLIPQIIGNILGCSCLHFQDPRKLISSKKKHDPACVFVDVHLIGGMNGLDFVTDLKGKFPNSCIFAMTADKNSDLITQSFSLGIDDFVQKPIDPVNLKARFLRRTREESRDKVIEVEDCKFDLQTRKIFSNEQFSELTEREMKLFRLLINHESVSTSLVSTEIWGDLSVSKNSIQRLVSSCRQKLGDVTEVLEIKFTKDLGYSFSRKTSNWRRVLLYDGNSLSLTVGSAVFSKLDYEVVEVEDAKKIEESINRSYFDYVVLDLSLEIETLNNVLSLIKKCDKTTSSILVGLVSETNRDIKEHAKKYGLEFFLDKPLDLNAVRTILSLSDAKQDNLEHNTGDEARPEDPTLDYEVLNGLLGLPDMEGDRFVDYLYNIFRPSYSEAWKELIGTNDEKRLSLIAHRVKGLCLNMGLIELSEYFAKLQLHPHLFLDDDFKVNLKKTKNRGIKDLEEFLKTSIH